MSIAARVNISGDVSAERPGVVRMHGNWGGMVDPRRSVLSGPPKTKATRWKESFRQACKILDFFAAADGRPRSALGGDGSSVRCWRFEAVRGQPPGCPWVRGGSRSPSWLRRDADRATAARSEGRGPAGTGNGRSTTVVAAGSGSSGNRLGDVLAVSGSGS